MILNASLSGRFLFEARLHLFAVLEARTASQNDSFAWLNARHNLDELRVLNSGVDGAHMDQAGRVDDIHPASLPRTVNRSDWNGDSVRCIRQVQLNLSVHAWNQVAGRVL